LIALSTQAYTFLTNKGGFTEGSRDSLPAVRRESYEQNGRNSKVLVKAIS
jgi:amino-acid N-acetyltransferase